jgi:hypothetical protein
VLDALRAQTATLLQLPQGVAIRRKQLVIHLELFR